MKPSLQRLSSPIQGQDTLLLCYQRFTFGILFKFAILIVFNSNNIFLLMHLPPQPVEMFLKLQNQCHFLNLIFISQIESSSIDCSCIITKHMLNLTPNSYPPLSSSFVLHSIKNAATPVFLNKKMDVLCYDKIVFYLLCILTLLVMGQSKYTPL